jgi:outer membrane protein TolC
MAEFGTLRVLGEATIRTTRVGEAIELSERGLTDIASRYADNETGTIDLSRLLSDIESALIQVAQMHNDLEEAIIELADIIGGENGKTIL